MAKLFSERKTGIAAKGDFRTLAYLCSLTFEKYLIDSWKDKPFGEDSGWYKHMHGSLEKFFLLKTKNIRRNPFSFLGSISNEDELFDMLECGYQYLKAYPGIENAEEFQRELNEVLIEWNFRMKKGQIENLPSEGLVNLVDSKLPKNVIKSDAEKIQHAQELFFRRSATIEQKKSAIKVLGDLLEHERENIKMDNFLNQDESDIFNILNNYSIRHHKNAQKELNEPYLTWVFYNLLNTVQTLIRVKANGSST